MAAAVEVDGRRVPWAMVRRLVLLGGYVTAPYRPVDHAELTELLQRAWGRGGPRLLQPAQRRQLAWLLDRYGRQRRPGRWSSCACRPPVAHLSLGGHVGIMELGPGDLVAGESGLLGRGLLATVEPELTSWWGPAWLAVTPRLEVPLARSGRDVGTPFAYGEWPLPTGRPTLGHARSATRGRVAFPRVVAGLRLGGWSVAAGVFPASVGVGLEGGGLSLSADAESVPQIVLRRTRPLSWSGLLSWFDPEHVLLRLGSTSPQAIRYRDEWGAQVHTRRPLLSQWLLTWDHTSWWRTTLVGSALAAGREGQSIWPDLLQVNLPFFGATWAEQDRGPVTDRLVSLIMEARWREAPWPWLPAAAGRIWWEYGGEDFRPHDSFGLLPEISAPASLAGIELVDGCWDVGVEYLNTRHPLVLWYSNSGFSEGYSHEGVLLGHELGGAAAAWTAVVRWRTAGGGDEWSLRGRTAHWEAASLPTKAARREGSLAWSRLVSGGAWRLEVGWVEERAGTIVEHWWRARAGWSF